MSRRGDYSDRNTNALRSRIPTYNSIMHLFCLTMCNKQNVSPFGLCSSMVIYWVETSRFRTVRQKVQFAKINYKAYRWQNYVAILIMKIRTQCRRAVKSCQLQSIFNFYDIVFLNLCTKLANTKNQQLFLNNSSCRSLHLALKAKSVCKSLCTNWQI